MLELAVATVFDGRMPAREEAKHASYGSMDRSIDSGLAQGEPAGCLVALMRRCCDGDDDDDVGCWMLEGEVISSDDPLTVLIGNPASISEFPDRRTFTV